MFNIKGLLEKHGHEVIPFSVISTKNEKTEYSKYFVEPIGNRDAIYFNEVKKTPKSIWQMIDRSVYSFEVKKAIQKEINDIKPDIVYIIHFINKLSPSVITGAKELGVPVVVRLSDYFLLCPKFNFLYKKKICEECLTKGYITCIKKKCVQDSVIASFVRVFSMKVHNILKVYDKVDYFITPSMFLKRKLIDNGFPENKIYCIPTFTDSKSRIEKQKIGTYGLYFGRITEEKGVEVIIKAYEEMQEKQLKIMGDDTTKVGIKLKAYVEEKRLNNIEFIGLKKGIELEKIIKEARFIIIPSLWYDNLPNVALESFQYFKPIVASDIGSLPELVINNYNGYLFKPGDIEDLKMKIELLQKDSRIAEMGIRGHKMLQNKFSSEAHYLALMDIFNKLTIEKKKSKKTKNI